MQYLKTTIPLIIAALFLLPTRSQAQFREGQIVFLQSAANDQLYLAAENGNTARETHVAVHTKSSRNEAACKWKLESAGGDWFYLRNVKSGLMLDVKYGRTRPGTHIWLWPENEDNAQKFRFQSFSGDRSFHLLESKLGSDLRVDLNHTIPTSGIHAILNKLENGRRVQKWKVIPVSGVRAVPPAIGVAAGKTFRLSKALFAGVANSVLKQLEVRLSNHGARHRDGNGDVSWFKPNDSYIKLADYNRTFTIPEYIRGVRDNRSYLYDMRLERVRARFLSTNELSVNLKFEENGPEIKSYCGNCMKAREDNGEPDYQFLNNQWEIRLKLIPFNGSVAYEVKSVTFLGEVDGKVFGELWDGIVQRRMIPVFEQYMKSTLESQKSLIARQIRQKATEMGVELPHITAISYAGNEVIFYGR